MKSRILKALYHFTVYAVGIIVLLAAVFVTLVRLTLPDIAMYRSEVEDYLYKYMGYPVDFASIDANWQGWIPELTLTDIDLLNKEGTQEITHFEKARIQIAPLATIIERKFIPRTLIISGFKLSVIRREDGSISIQDIQLEDLNVNQSGNRELAEWFFKQDEIELQNAQIEWIDLQYRQHEPIHLSDVKLKMRNDVGRFQVDGSARLPENYGYTMDFAFDVFGDLLTSQWSGELYLAAEDINPDNWYLNFRKTMEFNITGGNADLEVWMNWEQAKLQRLQGLLSYDDFNALVKEERALQFSNFTARFLGEKTGTGGLKLNVRLENLVTENGNWPDTDISITSEPTQEQGKNRYDSSFSYLKIDDLFPVLANISFLPEKARKFLEDVTAGGDLYNVALSYNPGLPQDEQFIFNTSFDHLTTKLGDNLPSLTNITGHVQGTFTDLHLQLQDSKAKFTIPDRENSAIAITNLAGEVHWQKHDDSWKLQTDEIVITTADVSSRITGSITKDAEKEHFLDLVMNLGKADLEKLPDYLPETEEFRLKPWLEKILLSGTLESASILYRGYLDDFPFDRKNGRFQVLAEFSDTSVEYSDRWPVADQLYGEINLNGREMLANIQSGKIFNSEIVKAEATVADILTIEKTVNLTGHMRGDIKDLTTFIDQSPLQRHAALHEIRNAMQSGEFGLDLKLEIPYRQEDKKPEVNGIIQFVNTVVDQPKMKIHVNDINGKVMFTGDTIDSETLTAEYENLPVNLKLSGTRDEDNPYRITINGEGNESFIIDKLVEYVPAFTKFEDSLRNRITGETPWQVQFTYLQDQQDNLVKQLQITSELKGLEMDLPTPLGKRKYASTPVSIETVLTDQNREVLVNYKNNISCSLHLDNETDEKLQTARIHIGQEDNRPVTDHGFQIGGKVDSLSVHDWLSFLNELTDENGESGHPVLNDIDLDLEISYLNMFNQGYSNVRALGRKTDWGWSFNIDDDEIKGDIYYPKNAGPEKHLTLLLDRIYIKEEDNGNKEGNPVDPAKLPNLVVEVSEVNFKGREMGKLSLQSSPIYNGASIDNFNITKDNLHISGNGTWLSDADVSHSKFKIDLLADDMGTLFNTFGKETPIKDGKTELHIVADWQGAPWEFAFKNLNGRVDTLITKGRVLDINPSAGRLFGLLSFQTLPRRLTLDFRDLFGKGLSFDVIEGKFDIANGNAYTNDLYMDSPAADIVFTGRNGLAEEDFDMIVTVTPQVTSSMPVAGAIFGPVGIGIGTAIYLVGEMFDSLESDIDNLLKHQYSVTGSWYEPVIEKVKEIDVVAGG